MKEHFLTILRDASTPPPRFRWAAHRLALLLAAETAARVPLQPLAVKTPMAPAQGAHLAQRTVLVPILRAGLALLPAFQELFPEAPAGFFGIRRDEKTAEPHLYYQNLPKISSKDWVFLLDPMLASAGSSTLALEHLRKAGASLSQTVLVGVVAAKQGIEIIHSRFPEVKIITAGVDPALNDKKFIVPGLGDFGDRYFGTI